jgi:hypothetical protein
VVGGSLAVDSAQWGVREQEKWLTLGNACVLSIAVDIPIVDKPLRTVTPTEMEPIETEVLA